MKYSDITEQIIGAAYKVHNVLGFGFFEKVYQKRHDDRIAKDGVKHFERRTNHRLLRK